MTGHRDCPWYISIAAIEEYMWTAVYHGSSELTNPDFVEAERALLELCASAEVRDTGTRTGSGGQIWRTGRITVGRRPRAVRLELTVMPAERVEGQKPQLVRVRLKG